MESTFQKSLKQVTKFPILLIVCIAVALFSLIGFFTSAGAFFNALGWQADRLGYYLGNPGYLFGNFPDFISAILGTIGYFFYVLQFLGVIALVVLLLGLATGVLELKKPVVLFLLLAGIIASYLLNPIEEIFAGFPLFYSPVSFMMRVGNILPMNLAALVSVACMLIFYRKKRVKGFALLLYIAGGAQIFFALLHILGSLFYGMPLSIGTLAIWLLSLVSPVLFVFLGLMLEKKLTGKDAPYVGKLVNAINEVSFSTAPSTTPAYPQGTPNTAWQPPAAPSQAEAPAPEAAPAVSNEPMPEGNETSKE